MTQPLGPLQLKLVEELESGKHEQCRGKLHNGRGYCCLGIAVRFVFGIEPSKTDEYYRFEGESNYLPPRIAQELATTTSGRNPLEDFGLNLADKNDTGHSFTEIAALIRANPEHYFSEPR